MRISDWSSDVCSSDLNADELRAVLARLADRKLVLIDTAGIGPRDAKLQAQLGTMGSASARIRNWLVLSANSHAADLDDVIRRYAKAKPSACVITKLDETLRIGGALSAVIRSEEHTSELQSLMRISYAVFCL